MPWDNIEDAFRELDKEEYSVFTKSLKTYFEALIAAGFTRRESFRLVENYAKFVYDMAFEEFMQASSNDDDIMFESDFEDDDEDVASDDDDVVM